MINWDKPKKSRPTKEHNEKHSSDSGIDGTYAPNMCEEDQRSWKGKHINKGKDNARIELRKTFATQGTHAQVLVIITHDAVTISTNGKIGMVFEDWTDFNEVVNIAKLTLDNQNE